MTETLRTVAELSEAGLVDAAYIVKLEEVTQRYALAVTPNLASLIESPRDPIARQFLPDIRELDVRPQELIDPIGDDAHSPVEGIVHRYPDRALLKLVHVCPAYCRFCFRRETVGKEKGRLGNKALQAALHYISQNETIWEVIFTGGDPFILAPQRILSVLRKLNDIPHVKILRWHTRVPIVQPERITKKLIAALKSTNKTTYIALHANHPQEFSAAAQKSIAMLADAGIPLLSQSVLLKGINDNIETLEALMRRFVELRIKPYYLHHPDLASGTSHFRSPLHHGRKLMHGLRQRSSGLCQPTYMLDLPGGISKVPAAGQYVTEEKSDYTVHDIWGDTHTYRDA